MLDIIPHQAPYILFLNTRNTFERSDHFITGLRLHFYLESEILTIKISTTILQPSYGA